MKFALSDEQRQFAAAIDGLLSTSDVPTVARAWASGDHAPGMSLWRKLAAMGVMELDDMRDVVVALEQLGRHAVPGPLVETIAVAPLLADPDLAARIAVGEAMATVAFADHLPYAVDADVAEVIGSSAHGPVLSSVDGARRLFAVDAPLADHPAFDRGVVACAAQLVGLGQAMLERAVAHVRTRTQFGGPIGRFQAVKHLLADVHIAVELARPLVWGAAITMTARDVSAAKVAAGDAADRAARAALQVHGALGYTQEYDLGMWLTKARALRSAWGTPSTHRARVMATLLAP